MTEIRVGDAVPAITKLVTQERINKWAKVSGDYNPLHVDPEYAKTTPYGGPIAHGPMTLSFFSDMMCRWLGMGWNAGGRLEISFIGPVRPGDSVTVKGTVLKLQAEDGRTRVLCEVLCENQRGEKVAVGKASGLAD